MKKLRAKDEQNRAQIVRKKWQNRTVANLRRDLNLDGWAANCCPVAGGNGLAAVWVSRGRVLRLPRPLTVRPGGMVPGALCAAKSINASRMAKRSRGQPRRRGCHRRGRQQRGGGARRARGGSSSSALLSSTSVNLDTNADHVSALRDLGLRLLLRLCGREALHQAVERSPRARVAGRLEVPDDKARCDRPQPRRTGALPPLNAPDATPLTGAP